MNNLDKQYTDLLKTILEHGVVKKDRTGTGTQSIFGYTIRHNMKDGFPLLTTKKMPFKTIVTELLWFLRGDTNIKFLVDNNCHIWDGDAYKNYINKEHLSMSFNFLTQEEFINKIKTDDEFAKKWGELGPIYGKQWRSWNTNFISRRSSGTVNEDGIVENMTFIEDLPIQIDQIQNLINDLKTNPDSRRLMVNSWNVGELDQMVLPPCHYGFQVYTRELSESERFNWYGNKIGSHMHHDHIEQEMNENNVPKRAISLMWNQRSVDTFLGLPFNIASYGLLLEIIAEIVNMVPDQLIGNLGDTHLYLNHLDQAREQIGKDLTADERMDLWFKTCKPNRDVCDYVDSLDDWEKHKHFDESNVPKRTREPYELPKLNINTEFWSYEGGECGIGPLDSVAVFDSFKNEHFCKCLLEEDIQLSNYQSHPAIKAPLSN